MKLDPAQARGKIMSFDREGEQMRELMKYFDIHKRRFGKEPKEGYPVMKMTLPKPLENLNLPNRVEGGEIKIT